VNLLLNERATEARISTTAPKPRIIKLTHTISQVLTGDVLLQHLQHLFMSGEQQQQ